MSYHHIQCPHCFTDYTISDEQYHATDGMMRCAACREQFKASIMTSSGEAPKFDPRDVFIEPLSSPLAAAEGGDIELSKEPEPSYVTYDKKPDTDEAPIELMSTHEFEYSGPKEPDVPEEVAEALGVGDELSTSEILRNLRKKNSENSYSETISTTLELSENETHEQLDLELPSVSERSVNTSELTIEQRKARLIEQANRLAEKKKQVNASQNESANTSKAGELFLSPKPRKTKRKGGALRILGSVIGLIIAAVLLLGLSYQLWLKQWLNLPTDNAMLMQAQQLAAPYLEQGEKRLAEYDITLPQRRNLSKLELLSAQTEPHPDRSTTVLLKVSLINRADIVQPLPWLEMTLTDADGRLVARRNLSPKDYIYKNQTNAKIGPNELKKVTIELLSFPKSATGYEIKLLNN